MCLLVSSERREGEEDLVLLLVATVEHRGGSLRVGEGVGAGWGASASARSHPVRHGLPFHAHQRYGKMSSN